MMLNASSSSVIRGITTPFSLGDINLNESLVKRMTRFQSSELFPDNSVDIEGTNLMSPFDKKSLKMVTLKSTETRQYSTSKKVSSNSYFNSP